MQLQQLLSPADIVVPFSATDKWTALDDLLGRMRESGGIPPELADDVHEAVLARERSMSTGMERGIAIPHAAVEGLEEIKACLAIIPPGGGLNFESIDASPVELIVLLLIPRHQKLLHIRTLADIARVLGNDEVREALLSAGSAQEAWDALGSA